jgi:hypothetical protein
VPDLFDQRQHLGRNLRTQATALPDSDRISAMATRNMLSGRNPSTWIDVGSASTRPDSTERDQQIPGGGSPRRRHSRQIRGVQLASAIDR